MESDPPRVVAQAEDGMLRPLRKEDKLMAALFVLVVSLLLLRAVGLLGVKRLSSWRVAGVVAVAIMFLFTGATHFTVMKHDYAAMLPAPLPKGLWIIYLTGALEIAGAVGLLIPRTRKLAGICLALYLVAVFPGNVYAALNDVEFRGEEPTPLWLRTPIQLFFIGMVWWTAIKERPEEVGSPRVEEPVRGREQASREGASS
jgi:uncharacterized membrane protein